MAIYPCFSCDSEFTTFSDAEEHISSKHGEEVRRDVIKVYEYMNKIANRDKLQEIYIMPARYLINNTKQRITAGYSNEDHAFYVKCNLETRVADLQTLKGYKVIARANDQYILAKKR